MKRFLIIPILLMLCHGYVACSVLAGEREEIQLKLIVLQEREARLRAEFELTQREKLDIQKALSALDSKEKEKAQKPPSPPKEPVK